MPDSKPASLNRRELIVRTGALATGVCLGLCSSDLFAADAPAAAGPVDAGPIGDYAKPGIYDKFAKSNGFFIVRTEKAVYATTATCTHRNSKLKCVDGQIRCPAHGSRFTNDGKIIKGPASVPLPRFAISKTTDGHVRVDTSKSFDEAKWNEQGSALAVE